jgi:hypothetical protein
MVASSPMRIDRTACPRSQKQKAASFLLPVSHAAQTPSNGVGVSEPFWRSLCRPKQNAPLFSPQPNKLSLLRLPIKRQATMTECITKLLGRGVISVNGFPIIIRLRSFKLHLFVADAAVRQSQFADKSQKLWHWATSRKYESSDRTCDRGRRGRKRKQPTS